MFSISFGEMAIIALVVLLVVGPKRMPEMFRFLGHLLGRVNRQARSLRNEIRREMEIEDLRQSRRELEDAVRGIGEEAEQIMDDGPREAGKAVSMGGKPQAPGNG